MTFSSRRTSRKQLIWYIYILKPNSRLAIIGLTIKHLCDGNKQETSNGFFINGSIVDLSLIGPMKGKTISDLVSSLNDGKNYVNVHTQGHPDGEIRGQLELSGSANMTTAARNETDTDTESDTETAIVTPTEE
jgi:CHRD domain